MKMLVAAQHPNSWNGEGVNGSKGGLQEDGHVWWRVLVEYGRVYTLVLVTSYMHNNSRSAPLKVCQGLGIESGSFRRGSGCVKA